MEKTQYEARKARSVEMLNRGVEPVKDGTNEYFVPSQFEQGKKYKVTIKNHWYTCECPDNKEGNLCKHILFLKTFFAIKLSAKKAQSINVSSPCPFCNSGNLRRNGTRKTIVGKKQRWQCLDCQKRFVNEPVTHVKGDTNMVISAIDLYMKGVSYRGIADSMKQIYGLKVTHVSIMNWVNTYMRRINEYTTSLTPKVGQTWHADEQFIKVKGKQAYVWNVLDSETRFLLASNQSPTRGYVDARETFKQAKAQAGDKARSIITDGAFSYEKAVNKEFRTYDNMKPHQRYVSLRDHSGNNNRIERFHESFRQRDKTMRGFKGNQKQYAENYKTYYNFVRPHLALNKTPAQAAGLNEKPEWRELLTKAVTRPLTTPTLTPEN